MNHANLIRVEEIKVGRAKTTLELRHKSYGFEVLSPTRLLRTVFTDSLEAGHEALEKEIGYVKTLFNLPEYQRGDRTV